MFALSCTAQDGILAFRGSVINARLPSRHSRAGGNPDPRLVPVSLGSNFGQYVFTPPLSRCQRRQAINDVTDVKTAIKTGNMTITSRISFMKRSIWLGSNHHPER